MDPLDRLEQEYSERAEAVSDAIRETIVRAEALADAAGTAAIQMAKLGQAIEAGFRRGFDEIAEDLRAEGL